MNDPLGQTLCVRCVVAAAVQVDDRSDGYASAPGPPRGPRPAGTPVEVGRIAGTRAVVRSTH